MTDNELIPELVEALREMVRFAAELYPAHYSDKGVEFEDHLPVEMALSALRKAKELVP